MRQSRNGRPPINRRRPNRRCGCEQRATEGVRKSRNTIGVCGDARDHGRGLSGQDSLPSWALESLICAHLAIVWCSSSISPRSARRICGTARPRAEGLVEDPFSKPTLVQLAPPRNGYSPCASRRRVRTHVALRSVSLTKALLTSRRWPAGSENLRPGAQCVWPKFRKTALRRDRRLSGLPIPRPPRQARPAPPGASRNPAGSGH